MKRLLLGAAVAMAGTLLPIAVTHADPLSYIPACIVGADPTLQYETLSFQCEAFTDPATGVHYNAIYVATPPPKDL